MPGRARIASLVFLLGTACGEGAHSDGGAPETRDGGGRDAGPRTDAQTDAGEAPAPDGAVDGGADRDEVRIYVGLTNREMRVYALSSDGQLGEVAEPLVTGNFPSFAALSPSRRFMYVVHEASREVATLRVSPGSGALEVVDRDGSEGAGPTHVAVNRDGSLVAVANYGGGSATLFAATPDGQLSRIASVSTGRFAHQAVFDSSDHLYVPCLGDEWIAQYQASSSALRPLSPRTAELSVGTGPRHMQLSSDEGRAYVNGERSSTVSLHGRAADATLSPARQTISTLPDGFSGSNSTAELLIHPNQRFVYVTNRGHNSVAIFRVNDDGTLAAVGHESTRGDHPRSMTITPDGQWLIVANKDTQDVQVFAVSQDTGQLAYNSHIDTAADAFFVGAFPIPAPQD